MKGGDYPQKYVDMWQMNIFRKDELISLFDKIGFKLTFEEEHYESALNPTLDYWLNNLDKLNSNEKSRHIQTLELSSKYLKQYADNVLREYGLGTFIFEKK